jgi:hypothetical protein
MKWSTLQHKEAAMLCEEGMTIAKARCALSIPHNIKHAILAKIKNNTRKIDKHCTNCGMTNHNVETCNVATLTIGSRLSVKCKGP